MSKLSLKTPVRTALAAVVLAAAASSGQAQVNVFTSAFLQPVQQPEGVTLFGFGRSTSRPGGVDNFSLPQASSVPFFDTWNIGTAGVLPGIYIFTNLTVDASGGSSFAGLTFNSFNEQGVRQTILFNLNSVGTQAVGSGNFTVLASCPVTTCVWIDVIGQSPVGAPWSYGGVGTALPIPEPSQWALLALGLVAVAGAAGAAKRRRLG